MGGLFTAGEERVDARVLASLVILNVAVHFVPFARPGFQPDDFVLLQRARVEPEWSFVGVSLSQGSRPLGFLLYTLLPQLLGLRESSQLAVLVSSTTLLTVLVYLLLVDLFPKPQANLAALVFILWPVKHEIYASQLFGVVNLAGALVIGAALLYRRWSRTSRPLTLGLSVLCYGLSILIYEIGYLAPLVFYLADGPLRSRSRGAAWFVVPAGLYWVLRLTHGESPIGGGIYALSVDSLTRNLVTSLPSNLVGFQLLRNIAYGIWAVLSGPAWFQLWCSVCAVVAWIWWIRSIREARSTPDARPYWTLGGGLVAAVLLTAPAAITLVESRHSILGAIGMAVVVSTLAVRVKPMIGTVALLTLLLATQGLALRQAEASRLQAAVRDVIHERRAEVRAEAVVVFDIRSLAERVPYTWGDKESNMLWGYWGIHAFSVSAFDLMVEDALYEGATTQVPPVRTCSGKLNRSDAEIHCDREYASERAFALAERGALVIDFKSMPLP